MVESPVTCEGFRVAFLRTSRPNDVDKASWVDWKVEAVFVADQVRRCRRQASGSGDGFRNPIAICRYIIVCIGIIFRVSIGVWHPFSSSPLSRLVMSSEQVNSQINRKSRDQENGSVVQMAPSRKCVSYCNSCDLPLTPTLSRHRSIWFFCQSASVISCPMDPVHYTHRRPLSPPAPVRQVTTFLPSSTEFPQSHNSLHQSPIPCHQPVFVAHRIFQVWNRGSFPSDILEHHLVFAISRITGSLLHTVDIKLF